MLAADVSRVFSDLTSLDHLSINALEYDGCGLLLWWISSFCPQLGSIQFIGRLDLWGLTNEEVTKFNDITQMTIEDVKPGISGLQAARLIDNFAPQLRTLSFNGEHDRLEEIYTAWAKFRNTSSFFKDGERSRVAELVRAACLLSCSGSLGASNGFLVNALSVSISGCCQFNNLLS